MGQPHLDFVKVREGACTLTRDTEDSVGYDLKSPSNYVIQAGNLSSNTHWISNKDT